MVTPHAPTPSPTPASEALRILPRARVAELLGLNLSTIWRMCQRGEFPRPIRLSPARCGWRQRDIEAWLAAREAASTPVVDADAADADGVADVPAPRRARSRR